MANQQLFELGRRTFDTPEFRGIEFIEVEAKSVINKVPAASRVPFDYTINPYRGCSHSCVYCVVGDTPILMADGTTKPIAKLSVGDRVYGTEFRGRYRRYVPTDVLAHWETLKPAFLVTVEDGTELIASGDHRFLTERGWKHVTGTEQGANRRPFLTTNNSLIGVGGFPDPPVEDRDYRLGYLAGMIRGDGLLGSWTYATGTVHRFCLALVDDEGLTRTRRFLSAEGVETSWSGYQAATATHRSLDAIRTDRSASIARIGELIGWPDSASVSWRKGFLAGVFDAEGSYSDSLRIGNTDPQILGTAAASLDVLGFAYRLETTARSNGMASIRLLGGFREILRFFLTVDPAITRKRTFDGLALKSDAQLRVMAIEPLGLELPMYDITTGTGDFIANGVVSHNCFARPSHAYRNLSPGIDFETRIFAKTNAAELLRKELSRPGYQCSVIAIGVNTDAYQPIERELRITRSILEVCAEFNQPVGLITKNATIERDLDIIAPMAAKRLVTATISLNNLDHDVARRLEPRCAAPTRRLQAMRTLSEAGVPVRVLLAPVIPFITDHQIERVLEAAREHGATAAGYVLLRLPWEVKDIFREWLERHYPLKAKHVMSRVHDMRGGRDNDPRFGTRMTGLGELAHLLEKRFELACRRLGFDNERDEPLDTTLFRVPADNGGQLPLF